MKHVTDKRYPGVRLSIILMLMTVVLACGVMGASARDNVIPEDLWIEQTYRPGPGKSVGNVQVIRGKAVIRHEKQDYGFLILEGMKLYNGDTLYVGNNGHIELALNDGSDLVLGSDTKIVINKIIFDAGSKSRLSFFEMLSGKARFIVKKLSDYKYSRFNVKTASAVVGVRGSDFFLEISQQGNKTVITALGHTILEILDPANPLAEPVIVTSFQQLVTVLGQIIGQPINLTEEEIMQLLRNLGLLLLGGGGQGEGGFGAYGGYIPHGGDTQFPPWGFFGQYLPGLPFFLPLLPPPILGPGPNDPFNFDPGSWIKPPLIIPELPNLPDQP